MKNKNYSGLKNRLYSLSVVLAIVVMAVSSFSCASTETADSKDVNQSKIHQNYTIVYDASAGNSYTVTAQFRFGGNKGTTLRLSDPSKVLVNNTEMEETSNVLSGTFYQSTLTGVSDFSFVFVDTEKKEYKNSTKLIPIKMKSIDVVDADVKNTIYWEGLPVASNESVSVTIQDNEGHTAIASTSVVGADNVVINPDDMTTLVAGKAQVYVTRSFDAALKEVTDDGGNFYTQYISEKISINLKKVAVAKTN